MSRHLIGFGIATFLLAGMASVMPPGGGLPLASAGDASTLAESPMPLPLVVVKSRIFNSRGDLVRLRGVNVAGMEWSSDGEGHVLETVETAIRDWHVNYIRLPMAQDRWFGKAPEQKDEGKSYRRSSSKSWTLVPSWLLHRRWTCTGRTRASGASRSAST